MAYKIPPSMNRSMLDFEPTIEGGGMRLKPLPLKVLLYWVGVLFVLLWSLTQSWITKSPIWLMVIYAIWFLVTAGYFGQYSKTKEMKFVQLPALIDYLPKANRNIETRSDSTPYKFMGMTGIKEIEDNGLIHYLDGSVGQAYRVVGWASRLLFDGDRDTIINRVNSFWKKVDTNSEWIFVTTKEPQRVYQQIANLQRQNMKLKYRDAAGDLQNMMEEKYDILDVVVGGRESSYNSIHQYLVIRSATLEHLRTAHSVLAAEAESGSSMFKTVEMLDEDDTLVMLQSIYRADDTPRILLAAA